MKNLIKSVWLLFVLVASVQLQAQKMYNEGTITYNIVVNTGNKEAKAADLLDGATQKIYFKGNQTRTELTSILGKTITVHDSKSGNAVVMNEYGDQKILIRMTKENYAEANSKFENTQFEITNETKTILGYTCKLAIAKMKDGSSFKVYFTSDISFQNKDYGVQFQNLPGYPLEYESEFGKMKVTYIADKITFDPVASALFDVPKSGFREMSYEDVKKARTKN